MTYLQAAQDIIEMYNRYAVLCSRNGYSCSDHSESIAIAVEALSITASLNQNTESDESDPTKDR